MCEHILVSLDSIQKPVVKVTPVGPSSVVFVVDQYLFSQFGEPDLFFGHHLYQWHLAIGVAHYVVHTRSVAEDITLVLSSSSTPFLV